MGVFSYVTGLWILSGFGALSKTQELIISLGLANAGAQLLFSSVLFLLLSREH